jgi:hypothetical protein
VVFVPLLAEAVRNVGETFKTLVSSFNSLYFSRYSSRFFRTCLKVNIKSSCVLYRYSELPPAYPRFLQFVPLRSYKYLIEQLLSGVSFCTKKNIGR